MYRALLNHGQPVERTVYLVSTSAGEVGIDLDADHLVCDLMTLDSMIQRLGRVNRRGDENRVAKVDVVVQENTANSTDKVPDFEQAVRVTQTMLARLPFKCDGTYDAGPRSLRELLKGLDESEKRKTFSPKPAVQPLTDILLDTWSLTSIQKPMPGRPEVAAYLHGLTDDPPETYIAWRTEVPLLDEADAGADTLRDWFRACRIEARERLRDRTDAIKKTLQTLLDMHRKENPVRDFTVILLNGSGEAERSHLSKIIQKEFNLAYRTVVLPVKAGGLTPYGTLDGRVIDVVSDVAEITNEKDGKGCRERWVLNKTEDGGRWERLLTGEMALSPPAALRELERVTLLAPSEGAEEGVEGRHLVLMVSLQRAALENPEIAGTTQTLEQHTSYIEGYARQIAKALKLDSGLEKALVTAAWWHDQGKARRIWQYFARNPDPTNLSLAKSKEYRHPRVLGGYRHEFGSLLQAARDNALLNHPERDLILHLIAAHHGWARPHFDISAWDHNYTTRDNEQAAAEVMRRFGRLQERFGRWGLAWLESLLRCADIAASKQSPEALGLIQSKEEQG